MNQYKPKTVHAIAHFDFEGSCAGCPCLNWYADVCRLIKGNPSIVGVPEGGRHEMCPLCIEEDENEPR